MKRAAVFAIAALMLSACSRPMTWNEMHGWMPRDEYRTLRALPLPARIQAPIEMRDC